MTHIPMWGYQHQHHHSFPGIIHFSDLQQQCNILQEFISNIATVKLQNVSEKQKSEQSSQMDLQTF